MRPSPPSQRTTSRSEGTESGWEPKRIEPVRAELKLAQGVRDCLATSVAAAAREIFLLAPFPTGTRNLSLANPTGPVNDARIDFRTASCCPSTSGARWLSNKRFTPLSRAASPMFLGGVCRAYNCDGEPGGSSTAQLKISKSAFFANCTKFGSADTSMSPEKTTTAPL